jgi:malate synthase
VGASTSLTDTKEIREDPDWRVADPAPGLEDRRVEITGSHRQEDGDQRAQLGCQGVAGRPRGRELAAVREHARGQANLRDSIDGTSLSFQQADGKEYALNEGPHAVPVVRPRGWHLPEKHVLVDDEPVSGGIFDFALYLLHSGQAQIDAGRGPYYYLPKMESHLEARLWNDVFIRPRRPWGSHAAPSGQRCSSRPTRQPSAWRRSSTSCVSTPPGLNAGRWDYLFSVIKKFRTGAPTTCSPTATRSR